MNIRRLLAKITKQPVQQNASQKRSAIFVLFLVSLGSVQAQLGVRAKFNILCLYVEYSFLLAIVQNCKNLSRNARFINENKVSRFFEIHCMFSFCCGVCWTQVTRVMGSHVDMWVCALSIMADVIQWLFVVKHQVSVISVIISQLNIIYNIFSTTAIVLQCCNTVLLHESFVATDDTIL